MSQFERAGGELGVEVIHAHSPQAKGRIERLFRTFQDRLIKEMRLAGISTKEAANLFLGTDLPVYNKRFRVLAAESADLHRPIAKGMNLNKILCIKTERTVRNDATVAHEYKLYQIEGKVTAKKMIVEERVDAKLYLTNQGRDLAYKEVTTRPRRADEAPNRSLKTKRVIAPTPDHPWRRPYKSNQREKTFSTT